MSFREKILLCLVLIAQTVSLVVTMLDLRVTKRIQTTLLQAVIQNYKMDMEVMKQVEELDNRGRLWL